ncbi:MAG: ATP-dependent helicase [Candidatus Njordarchaeia archaeon]
MPIKYAKKPWRDREIFEMLHPLFREWFKSKYGKFTPPQRYSIPLIHMGKNVLIFSPTGSGKTYSAFLVILNELYELDIKGELEDKVYCVYVSPLRALSNDIHRNLVQPLQELTNLAEERGYKKPSIRVAVRTGDTPTSERSKMLRKPPHILITTPESLAIVLNAPKFSKLLQDVKWVIVDEVHELSDNKRGVHLSLSLERLQDLVKEHELIRIGLSATQAPVEEIAKWLVGYRDDGEPRDCMIVNVYFTKKLDIKVITPVKNLLGASLEQATEQMYHIIKELIEKHRTTLIFTNTRSGTERVAFKLRELLGKKYVDSLGAHHSSLGRQTRLDVEERLKKGEMKVVVSSTSLELGIDIGYIDLVIQIGSPKSVAKGLQRIGRSGHALNKPSKGRIIVFDRDDLVECAVLVKAAYDGKIDRVQIPKNALDVLAQHIVGMSLTKKWSVDEAYRLIKRSYCYHELKKEDFLNVLKYLAGYYAELEDRQVYRKIWLDEEEGIFGRKRGSRMIYYLNLGTIPDEADYVVVLEKAKRSLGMLSEAFVERLSPGDIFVLGGRTYIFKKVKGTGVFVEPAQGRRPTVPSWVGEMLPRSFDLSVEVGKFREIMEELLRRNVPESSIIEMLVRDYRVDENSAVSIIEYFKEQIAIAGIVPSHRKLLIEEYIDRRGRQNIIFHYPFGRRVNDALSKAYAYIVSKEIKGNVATSLTDNGFMLTLPLGKFIEIEKIPKMLKSSELREVLKKAIFNTELFKTRFRHVATRSFMVLRKYKGHTISVGRQQVKSQQVLNFLVKKFPDFPVLVETFREILEDHMDVANAMEVLRWIEDGEAKVECLHSEYAPSPFAHSIILVGAEDVVILEDREALLRELHRRIVEKVIARTGLEKPKFALETVERLIKMRQHLDQETKGEDKDDILEILEDVGPLYLFRDKKPSIYERMSAPREVVEKWAHELLSEGKIISLRLPKGDSMWISVRDYPIYHKGLFRGFKLDDLSEKILGLLKKEGKASTTVLMRKLRVNFDELRFSLKILEQKHQICKIGFEEKGVETVVVWGLTENVLPKKIIRETENLGEREALEKLILRYLKSNGPTTLEELSTFTGFKVEKIREIMEDLENRDLVTRGYFYALKKYPQFIRTMDLALLEAMGRRSKEEKVYPITVIKDYLLQKHFLSENSKLKGGTRSVLKVLNEIGPVADELTFLSRIRDYKHDFLVKLQDMGEVFLAKGFRNKQMIMTTKQLAMFYTLRSDIENLHEFKKIIEVVNKHAPIERSKLVEKIGLNRQKVRKIIGELEKKNLIIRLINERLGDKKIIYTTSEKIFKAKKIKVEKSEKYILKLVEETIRWYSPVPKIGLYWLMKEIREELPFYIRKLEKGGKITKIKIINSDIEDYYIHRREKEKLEETYIRYLFGKIVEPTEEVTILSYEDPFAIRGIVNEISRSYTSKKALPIIKNGELAGVIEVSIKGNKMIAKPRYSNAIHATIDKKKIREQLKKIVELKGLKEFELHQ